MFERAISALISLIALAVAFVALAASAQVSLRPFYEAVARSNAAGKLGEIIKQEPVKTRIPGARAWRIAYVSSDVAERRTIATALVVAPNGPPPKVGRPVIAWAHGTTGTAQNCGPSQVTDPAEPLNQYFLVGGTSWTDYGLPSVEAFIAEGYVVVATDYQGLGGGGKHQYAVSATNARDAINSVRAAHALQDTGAGERAVVYGWSQGGGATIAAASLGDYIAQKGSAADGIEFLGFVALAPQDVAVMTAGAILDDQAAQKMVDALVASFSDNVFNFTHFVMNMWGTQAAFPDLRLTDLFTDEGADVIDRIVSNKCVHVAADTLNYNYGATYKSMLKPKATNALAWSRAFIDGSVRPAQPVAPVIIYWGTNDTVVPPVMGQLYREQMCKLGGNVTRIQLEGNQTHFSTPGKAAPLYVAWIKDLIAGKQVQDGCK